MVPARPWVCVQLDLLYRSIVATVVVVHGWYVRASLEAVGELAGNGLEGSHAASASNLSALRLLAPLN